MGFVSTFAKSLKRLHFEGKTDYQKIPVNILLERRFI